MPAAGYRYESSGALTNVGTWGLYHASSSYAAGSINSGYLNLNASNVNPLGYASRASALSVRCVQHLLLFFIFFDYIWTRMEYFGVQNGSRARSDADHGRHQRGRRFSNPLAAAARCDAASYSSRFVPKPQCLFRASNPAIVPMPATGYRVNSTGALENVGANGHWWSLSSYAAGNINAGSFFCDASRQNPLNNDNRANGFSVRCVQHLSEPFYLLLPIPYE